MDFACNVWYPLVGRSLSTSKSLSEIDKVFELSLKELELKIETPIPSKKEEFQLYKKSILEQYENAMLVAKDNGIPFFDDQKNVYLYNLLNDNFNMNNQKYFLEEVRKARLQRSSSQLNALLNGLSEVLPVELLSLWTPEELELMICGPIELNVDVLKKVTVYKGVKEDDAHVQYFWNTLEKMSNEEKASFVKFASACSRLPNSVSGYLIPFKIAKPESRMNDNPDEYLPIVSTCFFQMHLPKYTTQEICDEKISQAILECTTMDADVIERNNLDSFED